MGQYYTEGLKYKESRIGDIVRERNIAGKARMQNHDTWADDIEQRLQELPLCIETEIIKKVVLGTGGPHDEIRFYLDEKGSVLDITYFYNNWFGSGEEYTLTEDEKGSIEAIYGYMVTDY